MRLFACRTKKKGTATVTITDVPDTMFVLTNDTKLNGAAAILNDDTRHKWLLRNVLH